MPLTFTVTAGVDETSGPFPPTYPPNANGYITAASNPLGSAAGSSTVTPYYGATVLAVANDQAGAAATQLLVAIAGTHDQNFLGPVTVVQGDPYWDDVVLMLPFTGSNGGTATTDVSNVRNVVSTLLNGTTTSLTGVKFAGDLTLDIPAFNSLETYACGVPFAYHSALDIFRGNAWTIEGWVNVPTSSTSDEPFTMFAYSSSESATDNGFNCEIYAVGSNTHFSVDGTGAFNGGVVAQSIATESNTWNHVAVTWDGTTGRVFINGTVMTSTTNSWSAANYSPIPSSPAVTLGSQIQFNGTASAGLIEQFRVTAGLARYTANFAAPSQPFPTFLPPPPLAAVNANFVVTEVNGDAVSLWIWPLAGSDMVALTTNSVTFGDTEDVMLNIEGESPNSSTIDLTWTNNSGVTPSNYLLYRGTNTGLDDPTLYQTLSGTTFAYTDIDLTAGQDYAYYVVAANADGTNAASVLLTLSPPADPDISIEFNCDCESVPLPADGFMIDSLANLRYRMLIRAGYAAQANNPPPGMKLLCNEFLREAQNQLYRQHSEYRTKRLYAWQMEVNQRYYGFANDESDCRRLDPYSIDWVGFEDLNQAWYPLICGIDPVLYTRAQISTGWPTHYEIRSCIEIFPAPRAPYTLWIKGRFGLDPFTADTDNTTIDAEAIFLLATGLLKSHYGQIDGQSMITQALNYTKYLVAGQHNTRRYVPRTRVQTPMTPPRFLPTEE